jgi:pyridoxal phosphate-dependent aminotransferase EpsN
MTRIYLSPPHVGELERQLLLDAFDSNWIAPLGPHVDAFEREFAAAVGMPHAAALSSGTAALHLALEAVGVSRDDEVITCTLTFAATANAIAYLGGRPVFVDCDPETWTIDPDLLEEELAACARRGKRPAAVIAVDLYGQCADYDRIEDICRTYGVPLVEDAAEALGATYRGRAAGTFGEAAAFSFNGNKILTTSGGGMLVSRRSDLVERARYLSTQAREPAPHYQHSEIGYNYRMSNLLAALGRGQLQTLDERIERRLANGRSYREGLGNMPGITFMPEAAYGSPNGWLTCLTIDPARFGASREDVRQHLESLDIESRPVWKPMHLQPAFAGCRCRGGAVAADLFDRGLCLPSGSTLADADRERVIDAVCSQTAAKTGDSKVARVDRTTSPSRAPVTAMRFLPPSVSGLSREVNRIPNLSAEDLLARPPVGLDCRPITALIEGRRVLVTGAGGSIGSELARQIAALRPASLVLFERYENSLHDVSNELRDKGVGRGVVAVVGDVTDPSRVDAVMRAYRPEIVFHAAAHKHVPLMEDNPGEAVKNNVRGTRLLVEAAELHGVDRFIFISTDKAVNPTSVMGATKRVAELLIDAQARGSGTSFFTVRFGNVLGSNGSVVPRFLDQIRRGGPVTVTHPEMRRFFMLIPEAVQLVLHAAAHGKHGCTYVLEMGEQVKIVDMARTLIRLAGLVPDKEIPIVFTGLRPGEKLFEELVGDEETREPSGVDSVFRVRPTRRPDASLLAEDIAELEQAAAHGDQLRTLARLAAVVPEFGRHAALSQPKRAEPAADSVPEAAAAPATAVGTCPTCRLFTLQRSHARSMAERIKRNLTNERLHRCTACGWRGWLQPLDFAVCLEAEKVHIPDFSALDAAIGTAASRPAFSPRNLH